jgi:hypothetical protein
VDEPPIPDEASGLSDRPLRGRRQRPDGPKVYSEEEFNARVAEVIRERDRQATTKELQKAQSELVGRINQLSEDLQKTIREFREELVLRQGDLQRKHNEMQEEIEERTKQFRLMDLGPFEAGKFPDLLRWWARNEPIMTLLVARAVAESAVQDKEHSERTTRYYQTAIYASIATVVATVVTVIEWLVLHRP